MSSRHLVDPQLLPLLDAFRLGDLSDARIAEVRAAVSAMAPRLAPTPPGVTRGERWIAGEGGAPDLRLLVYEPVAPAARRPRPALLHIHGGGYVMGSPELSDGPNTTCALNLGAVVVSIDYRLAPEHPFPAALDDAFTALRWLHGQADALNLDRSRIVVSGESAGGGLAAALAQRARDAGDLPLALQMLAAPMLDNRTGAQSGAPATAGEFMWRAADNRYGWEAYLRGSDPSAPPRYATPGRTPDLGGLAPAFISVGALDLFVAEDLDYAARLIASGVPTELHVHPGGVHAFDLMPGTRIGATYARARRDALQRVLHP